MDDPAKHFQRYGHSDYGRIFESQSFFVDGTQSAVITVDCSVPQGSVLGRLEFVSYTEDVADVFRWNLVRHHLFADDKQLYQSGKISDIGRIRLHTRCW